MTQSLILQLTEKQQQIQTVQAKIPLAPTLEAQFELTAELGQLLAELAHIRTVYNSWQINEIKTLEATTRGY